MHRRLHLLQAACRTGARRARQDASPRGARGGTPRAQATEHALRYPSRAAAVLNHSARVLRCAPAASRLHDADPALHEARAWHAARALRHPFSVLSSLPAHSAEHMQGTQGTCARRAVPAQRCSPHPRQSPASRRASACRTQYCAHCSIFVTKRKQKKQNKDLDPTGKEFNKFEGRVRKNILPKFLRQTAFPSEIMIQKEFQKRKHPLFVTLLWRTPNPSRNNAECQTTRGQVCVAPSTPK